MRFSKWFLVVLIFFILAEPLQAGAAMVIPSCPSGGIEGHPPINQVPAYDYDSDGLVQFHFHFAQGSWNYNNLKISFYNEDCIFQNEQNRGQAGGVYLPPLNNLLVKVVASEPGLYNFKVYDEDTGEFQGTGLGFVPNDFISPKFAISLTNVAGAYFNPIVDTVSTPAVALRQSVLPPEREPVLIIPGVAGTELFENTDLLWPNLPRMLTDIGDDFLDSLAFNPDLTPSNSSVTAGDLVRQPFPGEHYYDSLIKSLEQNGYTENQDLFVFPYDWRYGVSEDVVSNLAATIESLSGGNRINVIAHSAGGLLLKKAIKDNGLAGSIDKAIMVGVPNYGAARAAKVLLYGDDMSIPWLDSDEIKKITQNMPIMYDLMPTSQYASVYGSYFQQITPDLFNPSTKKFDFQTAADHLIDDHRLNWQAFRNAEALHSYEFDKMDLVATGVNVFTLAGCGTPTLSAVTEIKQSFSGVAFPPAVQPAVVSGDGTVALGSAIGNNAANPIFYLLYANHGKLASHSGATEAINEILKDAIPKNFSSPLVTRDENRCQLHGKLISIFGDVAVQVKSAIGSLIYPDTSLGNASDIQLIQQPHYSLLHLPDYALTGTVELRSLSESNVIKVQVNDAGNGDSADPAETFFPGITLNKDEIVSLRSLDISAPIMDLPIHVNAPIVDLPADPTMPEGSESDSTLIVDSSPVPPTGGSESGGSESGGSGSSHPRNTSNPKVLGKSTKVSGSFLPHPEHTLIRFGPTIYLIESAQRRGFRSYGEFLSYGFRDDQVVEGNVADWNLPEGLIMLAKPGVLARDLVSQNQLYFLNQSTEKQRISTKNLANIWLKHFNLVFDIDLTGYREGMDIINTP